MKNHIRCSGCGRRHKAGHDKRIGTKLQYDSKCEIAYKAWSKVKEDKSQKRKECDKIRAEKIVEAYAENAKNKAKIAEEKANKRKNQKA